MEKSKTKRILCYGDSNTWGFIPVSGGRYDEGIRWTSVAQKILGEEFRIVESGLNGRTSVFEHPFEPCKNGADALGYSLLEAIPLDLVIIMLGTNDLMFTDARGAARGVGNLIERAHNVLGWVSTNRLVSGTARLEDAEVKTKFLIMSPILVHPELDKINPGHGLDHPHEKSLEFDKYFRAIAESAGAWYLNAADVAQPSIADGIHMEPEGHLALGHAVADKVLEIFQEQ